MTIQPTPTMEPKARVKYSVARMTRRRAGGDGVVGEPIGSTSGRGRYPRHETAQAGRRLFPTARIVRYDTGSWAERAGPWPRCVSAIPIRLPLSQDANRFPFPEEALGGQEVVRRQPELRCDR